MPYNPNIHHRRSIRLKGYDYSQSGYYFITLCVKNGRSLFGKIIHQQMILNDAGRMVAKWYEELSHKYPDIECGEYMVMPNHFHCILFNNGHGNPNMQNSAGIVRHADAADDDAVLGEHIGSPLRNVIQWYKTMTTNEYIRGVKTMGWKPFEGKSGHINYWEHIIRTQQSYDTIAAYILHNPQNWDTDTLKE